MKKYVILGVLLMLTGFGLALAARNYDISLAYSIVGFFLSLTGTLCVGANIEIDEYQIRIYD